MSQPTVVILTEPERCDLADPDLLLQAVLQLQQISAAGMGASRAFCDHPAAAMKFLEAYAKAYPELQLRSADLPPPEALYSIVADGGVRPLQVPAVPDGAKPGEAGQLLPMYVLSLGAPDALMRALQNNGFAQRDIQVVEIPPAEGTTAGSMPIARAVAQDPLARSSWRAEGPADPAQDEDEALPADEAASDDALKLSSVEVNLDHIRIERSHDRSAPGDADEAHDDPAIVVPTPPSTAALADPRAPSGATTGATDPVTSGPHLGTVAEPAATSSKAAVEALTETKAELPLPAAGNLQEVAVESAAPEGPVAGADEVDPGAGVNADKEPVGSPVDSSGPEASGDQEPAAVTEPDPDPPTASAERPREAARDGAGDLSDDVLYPATGSFAMAADVTYPLPEGLAPGAVMFDALLDDSGSCDVVDVEALCRLSETSPPDSDPVFDLIREATRGGVDGAALELVPDRDAGCSGPVDEDSAAPERQPASHDLDI